MSQFSGTQSLGDFKRNTAESIERLKRSGRPRVLTVGGRAELVVQDAASYRKMCDLLDRAEAIEGVRAGLEDARQGRVKPAEQAFAEMREKLDIPHGG